MAESLEDGPFDLGLCSERLTLRMPVPDDLEVLTALDADPLVMQLIHKGALNIERARRFADSEIERAARFRYFGK